MLHFLSSLQFGLIIALIGSLPMVSHAVPILNPANGHYYEVVNQSVTWDQARVDAASLTFNGAVGHLVTMADAAENAFVVALALDDEVWIGLTDSTATSTIDGFDLSTLGTGRTWLSTILESVPAAR